MTRRPVLFDLGGTGKTPGQQDARAETEREAAAREDAERAKAEEEAHAAREKAERERAAEAARAAADRERAIREEAERQRLAAEAAAREAREQAARERAARDEAERQRLAAEAAAREAREQAARDAAERERLARSAARDKAERDRQTREAAEHDRAARDAAERAALERAEREALERERAERERVEQERAEREARERAEREERAERDRAARERAEREAAERERMSGPEADRDRADRPAAAGGRPRVARSPRLFEPDVPAAAPVPSPADVPPVPEPDAPPPPEGRAMQTVALLAARRPSRLMRFFWSALGALIGFAVSLAAWDFVTGLFARNPVLGTVALVLTGLVLAALALIMLGEVAAFGRLRRLDRLHADSAAALASHDLTAARAVLDRLLALYAHRDDTRWGRERVAERRDDILDADALLGLAEREVLAPLDAAATREVEAAARTVAAVTALVPLALADVFAALTANLRMIRRIAEIYGGRSGLLGGLRLARAVMTHLVATGAVAVGDDMIGSIAGGSMLARVSRRFGEGIVNGALTARVGVAAMEVCRPLPFRETRRPSVGALVKRALAGVFSRAEP